jgi:NAD(P)H-hydrate epimerase
VALCNYGKPLSADAHHQYEHIKHLSGIEVIEPDSPDELEHGLERGCLIDALFGSGLNRPLSGLFAETVEWMNKQQATCIAIDLPSGLFGEDNSGRDDSAIVRASITLSLQCPRLACFMPENEAFIGTWETINIGLDKKAMDDEQTPWSMTVPEEAAQLLKTRSRFSHKGLFGRTLLIAGSPGMTGACVLAGRGALRSGAGLLTLKVPDTCLNIVQTALPEATAHTYTQHFWNETDSTEVWSAIAAGPGLSLSAYTTESLERLMKLHPPRLVLDADALNALAQRKDLLERLPAKTILTPHPGEFDRMTKPHRTGFERLQTAISFAQQYGVYVVLKGAYTACITPEGRCRFNLTGNPGMATGGSGDVLTGIIVSLLSQGYTHEDACVLGTCLHGLSADLALEHESQESLTAGDITTHLGKAFRQLKKTAHPETA